MAAKKAPKKVGKALKKAKKLDENHYSRRSGGQGAWSTGERSAGRELV